MNKSFVRTLLFAVALGAILFVGTAQNSNTSLKMLTLDRVMPGGSAFRSFYPSSPYGVMWLGEQVISYDEADNYRSIKQTNHKGESSKLMSVGDLNVICSSIKSYQSNNYFPSYYVTSKQRLAIQLSDRLLLVDPNEKTIVEQFIWGDKKVNQLDMSPDETMLLVKSVDGMLGYLESNDASATIHPIAQDDGNKVVYGEAVHQREFGIEKGVFWSPDSRKIAYYRMDQSMVEAYPIVNTSPKKAEVVEVRYPMAGSPSHHVTLHLFDVDSNVSTKVQTTGDPELFLTNISWHPSSQTLYIAELNRGQNFMELNSYSSVDGSKQATLFTEQSDKYVEPLYGTQFVPGTNGDQFIWISRKGGYQHLYLYTSTGKELRHLTQQDGEVIQFLGFDQRGKTAYVVATFDSPIQKNLYAVRLRDGKTTRITKVDGTHSVQASNDFEYFIDNFTSITVPRIVQVLNKKGKVACLLHESNNPDEGYVMPTIETGTIKAADGETDLYYRLVKPVDFDPTKKYPTIIYVYGGPHAQLVTDSWHAGAGGWDLYMAQEGYVMFTVDNRGSANRGAQFEQVIHRQLGTEEMKDQMCGVKFLKSHEWVDADRIGVHGWSFGGFMTTNLMLTHSDLFKVGVAGGPVMDWSRYETMYGERYMDMPQENEQGYQNNNLTLRANDLKGRLLLIHGTSDDVVVWQHAQEFVRACVTAKTYPDCMFYPGHKHNVSGQDRVHLYQTISRYFFDFL